jgi:hypothetical protein
VCVCVCVCVCVILLGAQNEDSVDRFGSGASDSASGRFDRLNVFDIFMGQP